MSSSNSSPLLTRSSFHFLPNVEPIVRARGLITRKGYSTIDVTANDNQNQEYSSLSSLLVEKLSSLPAAYSIETSLYSSTNLPSTTTGYSFATSRFPIFSNINPNNTTSLSSLSNSASNLFSTQIPVLIKYFESRNPGDDEILRLRYEYMSFQSFSDKSKLRMLQQQQQQQQHVDYPDNTYSHLFPLYFLSDERIGLSILYSDIGGLTLNHFSYSQAGKLAQENLSCSALIDCALSLCNSLSFLHDNSLSYNSLCPHTILYNPSSQRCLFLDYSQACLLESDHLDLHFVNGAMSKSLTAFDSISSQMWSYMSPEQTARMNRSIDSRSDLYSLGCVLYYIMTGLPPFPSNTSVTNSTPINSFRSINSDLSSDDIDRDRTNTLALEMIHCHLAKTPTSPFLLIQNQAPIGTNNDNDRSEADLSVLLILSNIILKLLAKDAEERYQSCHGLRKDLDHCRNLIKTQSTLSIHLPETLVLPESLHLPISHRLSSTNKDTAGTSASTSVFSVGETDVFSQFHISQKIYGRQAEVVMLMEAFERISKPIVTSIKGKPISPRPEWILVCGYSGIGKTRVIDEIHKKMVESNGLFVRGKFDLYRRNVSILLEAFQQLIQQILIQNDVSRWKSKIESALGDEAQVIVQIIPSLVQIIGHQPSAPALPPIETERRLKKLFPKFVQVFSTAEHPLVIFIDDLQWADDMSLSLLQVLYEQSDIYLLLIGAYRDNEVDSGHPLIKLVQRLREQDESSDLITSNSKHTVSSDQVISLSFLPQSRLQTIKLGPLLPKDVTDLIKDTLHSNAIEVANLSTLLATRVQGNPFFLTQILKSLHTDGIFTFNYHSVRWCFDIEEIKFSHIPENVADLLCQQILAMNPTSRLLLQVGACLGNQFFLSELASAINQSQETVASHLWQILESGLILSIGQSYQLYVMAKTINTDIIITQTDSSIVVEEKEGFTDNKNSLTRDVQLRFLHDRCQQASYCLMSDIERQHRHLQIGRGMIQNLQRRQLDLSSQVISIVRHFNAGLNLLTDQIEMIETIKMNKEAAVIAKNNTAYEAAVKYMNVAKSLLIRLKLAPTPDTSNISYADNNNYINGSNEGQKDDCWKLYYNLTVETYLLLAECLLLYSSFADADNIIDYCLTKAPVEDIINRELFLELKQRVAISESRYNDVLTIGLKTLTVCGFILPEDEEVFAATVDEESLMIKLRNVAESSIMKDPIAIAIMRVLILTFSAAYFLVHPIHSSVVWGMLVHSFKHGMSYTYPFSLSCFTHVLHEQQRLGVCYRVGRLALELVDQYARESRYFRCKVHSSFSVAVFHWAHAMADGIPQIERASALCLEAGDHEYLSYTTCFTLDSLLYSGRYSLEKIQRRQKDALNEFIKKKLFVATKYINMWRICIAKLLGQLSIDDEEFFINEEEGSTMTQASVLASMKDLGVKSFLFACYCAELTFSYFSGQYSRAITCGEEALKIDAWIRGGLVVVPQVIYYYSLALIADLLEANQNTRNQYSKSNQISYQSPSLNQSFGTILQEASNRTRNMSLETSPLSESSSHFFQKVLSLVESYQSMLSLWSKYAPMNYLHKFHLIEAERLHLHVFTHPTVDRLGPRYELVHSTLKMYDSAILGARINKFLHEEALASELAALFCISAELDHLADPYVRSAYNLYAQWGCTIKLTQLKNKYPQLFLTENIYQSSRVPSSAASSSKHLTRTIATRPIMTSSSGDSHTIHSPITFTRAITQSSNSNFSSNYNFFPSLSSPSEVTLTHLDSAKLDSLDLHAVMKSCVASVDADLSVLARQLMEIVMQHAAATKALLLYRKDGADEVDEWSVESAVSVDNVLLEDFDPKYRCLHWHEKASLEDISSVLPVTLLNYTKRTKLLCSLTERELKESSNLLHDPYLLKNPPKFLLMLPIIHQSKHLGTLYLENRKISTPLDAGLIQVLQTVTTQVALSIENARLYRKLNEQNDEVRAKNLELELQVKQKEAAEKSMQTAKESAEKAAAGKSLFLSHISHEIRTPLNAILGLNQILLTTELSSEQQEHLNVMSFSSNLLLAIIDDVLNFSRMESNTLILENEWWSLADIVESIINICYSMATNKQIDLCYIMDQSCPVTIYGDASRIQQILFNLVANACKFTERGAVNIKVTTSLRLCKSALEMLDMGEKDIELQISITDTGIGMNDDIINGLFNSFEHIKLYANRVQGGAGLGLVIAKRVVDAMNGTISVESQVEIGSKFSFAIPTKGRYQSIQQSNIILSPYLLSSQQLIALSKAVIMILSTNTFISNMWRQLFDQYKMICRYDVAISEVMQSLNTFSSVEINACNVFLVDSPKEKDNEVSSSNSLAIKHWSTLFKPFVSPLASRPALVIFLTEKEVKTPVQMLSPSSSFRSLSHQRMVTESKSNNKDSTLPLSHRQDILYTFDTADFDIKIMAKPCPHSLILKVIAEFIIQSEQNPAAALPTVEILNSRYSSNVFSSSTSSFNSDIHQSQLVSYTPAYIKPTLTSSVSRSSRIIQPISSEYPLNIMLAEDNPINGRLMRNILTKLGYNNVPLAEDGSAVLQLQPLTFDVVLMDIGMSPMDGIQCTILLREEEKKQLELEQEGKTREEFTNHLSPRSPLYIIAQTANSKESRDLCFDAGMNDFLQKPINIEALKEGLKKAYLTRKLNKRVSS